MAGDPVPPWVVIDYGAGAGAPVVVSVDALGGELRRALSHADDMPMPIIWLWRSGHDSSPVDRLVLTRVSLSIYDENYYATAQWQVVSSDRETEYARFSTRIDGAA